LATRRFGARTTGQLDNLEATAAPSAANDVGEGYAVGSIWIDVTGDIAYVCVDSTENTAIWDVMAAAAITPSAEIWAAITNDTEDRTMDANATTIDELADIVGTLIGDLVATGILAAA
jgi:hypothetical protein